MGFSFAWDRMISGLDRFFTYLTNAAAAPTHARNSKSDTPSRHNYTQLSSPPRKKTNPRAVSVEDEIDVEAQAPVGGRRDK